MPEPQSELLQSLDRTLEESRRLREESSLLLDKAQWPEIGPIRKEENSPPVPDSLGIPVPPLLGFQRDKGNLPLGRLTPAVHASLQNPSPGLETPAGGQNPAPLEAASELVESETLELAIDA